MKTDGMRRKSKSTFFFTRGGLKGNEEEMKGNEIRIYKETKKVGQLVRDAKGKVIMKRRNTLTVNE